MTATEEITIRVDPATAKAYREATPERLRKLERLMQLSLFDDRAAALDELSAALDSASAQAAANGLTDEILADILRECRDDRRA